VKPHLLGWKKDLPDNRDYKFRDHFPRLHLVSTKVDLRKEMSGVEDQGELGSCVANAVLSGCEHLWKRAKVRKYYQASRLWLYYKLRELLVQAGEIASTDEDSGAYVRDAIKILASLGVPNEAAWPYKVDRFRVVPPVHLEKKALPFRIGKYYRLSNVSQIKEALQRGFTVSFGMNIYESFYQEKNGVIPVPQTNEAYVGGHAMQIVGFDDLNQWFIVRNSWGKDWGDNEEGDDFWTFEIIGHGETSLVADVQEKKVA
jgi:C1A family cysteine protease